MDKKSLTSISDFDLSKRWTAMLRGATKTTKSSKTGEELPTREKAVFGGGSSPGSSVRTNRSNRGEVDGHSLSVPSPSKSGDTPFDAGGSTRGKRLFEPTTDPPFARRRSSTHAISSPQISPANSPQQQISQSFTGTLQQTQRLNPEPKQIPINLLSVTPQFPQENPPPPNPEQLKIVRQPETRPISQEQLVAEVRGIYAGLVMVEGKCIQVDQKQAALAREAGPGTQLKLSNEQWQALIALHRTLLHEHHDFFLASQHPSATPAVKRLAVKYAMPARLWRHGIHSFLELLRNRLPDSLDHMLAFIYLAYSMMTLLYETVPAFEDTWIECLGDLGRYRMAIEDDDIRDREVWTQVARQWYLKASDKQPATGRLYHHLAILARPTALQQMFFYGKALSVSQPFIAARESVLTLFEPDLIQKQTKRFPQVAAFLKMNEIIFLDKNHDDFAASCDELTSLLDSDIARLTQNYLKQGYYGTISNFIALLSFGSTDSIIVKALSSSTPDTTDITVGGTAENAHLFKESQQLFNQTASIVLQEVFGFLHVLMVFAKYVSRYVAAMVELENVFPWGKLVTMLETLIRFSHSYDRIEQKSGRRSDYKNDLRPYPEESVIRGLLWELEYFATGKEMVFPLCKVWNPELSKQQPASKTTLLACPKPPLQSFDKKALAVSQAPLYTQLCSECSETKTTPLRTWDLDITLASQRSLLSNLSTVFVTFLILLFPRLSVAQSVLSADAATIITTPTSNLNNQYSDWPIIIVAPFVGLLCVVLAKWKTCYQLHFYGGPMVASAVAYTAVGTNANVGVITTTALVLFNVPFAVAYAWKIQERLQLRDYVLLYHVVTGCFALCLDLLFMFSQYLNSSSSSTGSSQVPETTTLQQMNFFQALIPSCTASILLAGGAVYVQKLWAQMAKDHREMNERRLEEEGRARVVRPRRGVDLRRFRR